MATNNYEIPLPHFTNLPQGIQFLPWNVDTWKNWDADTIQKMVAYNQQQFPWLNLAAQQANNEASNALERDQLSLATRKQGADEAYQQWQQGWLPQQQQNQLGWEKEKFTGESALKTREMDDLRSWRDTQATLQREQMQKDAENAALSAWSRKFRPNVRYMG